MRQRRSDTRNDQHLPVEALESIAENMKERIYATITLLAMIVALWQTSGHHTAGGAVINMLGTVAALWLATIMSARMSHRAVHGKSMTLSRLRKLLFTSSGLFAPAILPVAFVLASMTGVTTLKNALFAGVVILVLSLFFLSFHAGRRIHASFLRLIVISMVEMLVGVGVVALKLFVGE